MAKLKKSWKSGCEQYVKLAQGSKILMHLLEIHFFRRLVMICCREEKMNVVVRRLVTSVVKTVKGMRYRRILIILKVIMQH